MDQMQHENGTFQTSGMGGSLQSRQDGRHVILIELLEGWGLYNSKQDGRHHMICSLMCMCEWRCRERTGRERED